MKLRITVAISLVLFTVISALMHVYTISDYNHRVQLSMVWGIMLVMAIAFIVILMLSHYFREKESIAKISSIQKRVLASSRFLAHMSHEIRAPLTSLLAIPQTELLKHELHPEIKDAFLRMCKSGDSLLSIVSNVLDLSQIEAGKMTLTIEKYEVAAIVCEVAQLHLAYIEDKHLDFIVDVDENIPEHLFGDELRIKQILNNILSNAIKYTDSGSIVLTVCSIDTADPEITNLLFSISDTGRGMTDKQLAVLFDEYTRFHESSVDSVVGTGLGMPIIIELLQLMGGEIDVTSQVNIGTSVTFVLPQRICNPVELGSFAEGKTGITQFFYPPQHEWHPADL